MLTTTKEAERRVAVAREEAKKDFISCLEAWHKRQSDHQATLEASFDLNDIKAWCVNVWDDYPEEGTTYAYVEMPSVPNCISLDVLLHLLTYGRSNCLINKAGVSLNLRFQDLSSVYPALIGNPTGEYSLFKRWEITIVGASYEALDQVVYGMKQAPMYLGKPFDVISES
ncbi:hypothetical protein ACFQDN_21780 [Pseudomonas asuensis]|uniref:Uncharacterized protein n=1 Tax=Pseudomonas asuensis TaxID=1825787 RepID=A0ABQ2H138_9PSED|nr:hypothetical protein [Pseudomonas asuensis]GGM25217.1 hypothetical protein GCM10009425_40020 [Pseudomonas asuensis]